MSERVNGKSLYVILRVNPIQNCFMPSKRFLGINSLMALGMAIAAAFATLYTWLIAPGIAIATLLLLFALA